MLQPAVPALYFQHLVNLSRLLKVEASAPRNCATICLMEYTKDSIRQVFTSSSFWLRDSESFIAARPMSYHDDVLYCRVRDEDLRALYPKLPETIAALLEYDRQKLRPNGGAPQARTDRVKQSIIVREEKLPTFTDSNAALRTPVLVDALQFYVDRLYIEGLFAELYTTRVNDESITVVTRSIHGIADIKSDTLESHYPGFLSRLSVGKSLELPPEELFAYVLSKAPQPGTPDSLSDIDLA